MAKKKATANKKLTEEEQIRNLLVLLLRKLDATTAELAPALGISERRVQAKYPAPKIESASIVLKDNKEDNK